MNDIVFERSDALPIGTMLHGHEVLEVMNAGAFGIAYKVVHVKTGYARVIKEYMPDSGWRMTDSLTIVPKSTSEQVLFDWGLRCFIDEAQLLMQLKHPNIVPVLEAFKKFGTAYFVMPFIEGQTLTEWTKINDSPSQEVLENIFLPLLEGLKYLHEIDYLHRDIKPDNIIVAKNGNPILIDFGTARQTTASKSQVLTKVLTPHYAALEQYSSKGPFTPALDLYGLAACMYYVISRQIPEEAPDRVRDDYYQPLQSMRLQATYSESFLQAIDQCLKLFPEDRFKTGLAFQLSLMGESNDVVEDTSSTDNKSINQLRALITFSGKDGVISLQEERGLLEEAQALNISEKALWQEIRQQASDNGWTIESDNKGGDEAPALDPPTVMDQDIESLKERYKIKGFKRFLFHFFGVLYSVMLLLFAILMLSLLFDGELTRAAIITMLTPSEGSLLFWLGANVVPENITYFIVFIAQLVIPVWYLRLYFKIINLKNKQADFKKVLASIIASVPNFLVWLYLSAFLMFNWMDFILSFIGALFVVLSLMAIFSVYTNRAQNASLGLNK